MKLQQFRYIWEVAHHDLNVSATAQALYTSQPGISKQIRLLEDELGVEVFERSGKHLSRITPAGEKIVAVAGEILQRVDNVKRLAKDFSDERQGSLSIATTHTQARYALPDVVRSFREAYPDVVLQMNQGSPDQIADLAASGDVDFAIATEGMEHFADLVMMPCYKWNRSIVIPKGHPLAEKEDLTLDDVATQPLVTYVFGFTGKSTLDGAFEAGGHVPNVVFTATDTDVIKTYVRLGLGIGIIASMAFDPEADTDLVARDASHLFASSVTQIVCRKGTFLRNFMLDFIGRFAPHLSPDLVRDAVATSSRHERDELFRHIALPVK